VIINWLLVDFQKGKTALDFARLANSKECVEIIRGELRWKISLVRSLAQCMLTTISIIQDNFRNLENRKTDLIFSPIQCTINIEHVVYFYFTPTLFKKTCLGNLSLIAPFSWSEWHQIKFWKFFSWTSVLSALFGRTSWRRWQSWAQSCIFHGSFISFSKLLFFLFDSNYSRVQTVQARHEML
jgi:hypothetical protein